MPTGVKLTEAQKGAFIAAIGAGLSIAKAAEMADASVAPFYQLRDRNEAFAAQWVEAKRVRTDLRRDWVTDKLHQIAEDDDHRAQFAALAKLFDALPENRVKTLELEGPSQPIVIEHRRGLTVADLIADSRAADLVRGLVDQARRELPAASAVLAEPVGGVDPAGDLPAGPAA